MLFACKNLFNALCFTTFILKKLTPVKDYCLFATVSDLKRLSKKNLTASLCSPKPFFIYVHCDLLKYCMSLYWIKHDTNLYHGSCHIQFQYQRKYLSYHTNYQPNACTCMAQHVTIQYMMQALVTAHLRPATKRTFLRG